WDAHVWELWTALLSGARCVLYPAPLITPEDMARAIQEHGVTTMVLTPKLFNVLIDLLPQALAGVRQLMVAGEALAPPHGRLALECVPQTQPINPYRPPEAGVTTRGFRPPPSLPGDLPSGPIGRPIGDRQVYILDARGNRVPGGVPGELCIAGPALA